MKRTIALTTATALAVGSGALLLAAAPAQADGPERHAHGNVAGARYEMSAEKDNGRFEVDADLEGVPSGSSWKMVVRHDGTKVATRTAQAGRDDGRSTSTSARSPGRLAGKDDFKVTLTRTDGAGKVTRTLTFSS